MDENESTRRRRCRPDELCSTVFNSAALSDCDQSTGVCECPSGYVLQDGACVGQFQPGLEKLGFL